MMDLQTNRMRNGLTHARANFSPSETSSLLRGGGGRGGGERGGGERGGGGKEGGREGGRAGGRS